MFPFLEACFFTMTEDLARQCSAWLKGQKNFKDPVYSSHFK
ncbi:hypothetical protein LBUL_1162 [Lactobacillus delbrueckii subsp. bulgaricus ATCC BAA-365]|nr:hypothetical protein LBUL_1162 [Lactobacillus delbrueckii subsp. bulgaricus ATCC BAA-365]